MGYHPQSDSSAFTLIGYIWLCKIAFLVMPFVYFTGVSMFFGFVGKFYRKSTNILPPPSICPRICSLLSHSIWIGILHFIGLFLGTMCVEIGCLSYIAFLNWFFVTDSV